MARRLQALGLGCAPGQRVFVAADSAPVKRAFAVAIETAFPGVSAEYFDGVAPPKYDVWLGREAALSGDDWLALVTTTADWLCLGNARLVIGVKGTTSGQHLPSSFARTASLVAASPFDDLARIQRGAGTSTRARNEAACCEWLDMMTW